MVRFDSNWHSVEARAAGRPVEGRDRHACDVRHFIPIPERKPGALRNGAPFRAEHLPPEVAEVKARLESREGGGRQMVRILLETRDRSLAPVATACAEALEDRRLQRLPGPEHPVAALRSRPAAGGRDAGRAGARHRAGGRLRPLRRPAGEARMRRSEILGLMTALGLRGMKAACDEALEAGRVQKRGADWVLGTLLEAEAAGKRARSVKCQLTVARLPAAKDLAEFDFPASPVDEAAVRQRLGLKTPLPLAGETGRGASPGRSCHHGPKRGLGPAISDLGTMKAAAHDARNGRSGRIVRGSGAQPGLPGKAAASTDPGEAPSPFTAWPFRH